MGRRSEKPTYKLLRERDGIEPIKTEKWQWWEVLRDTD